MDDLKSNILKLQNIMKKDPESYAGDFEHYMKRFKTLYDMQIRKLDNQNAEFLLIMGFLGSVVSKYPKNIKEYFQILFNIISIYGTEIESKTRFQACLMLFKLRKYNLVKLTEFLDALISLLVCKDKLLRSSLLKIIVKDLKNGFQKSHFDQTTRNKILNCIANRLSDNEVGKNIQYTCACIMLEMWRRNICRDEKTANFIVAGAFSSHFKVSYLILNALKGNITKPKEFINENIQPESVRDVLDTDKKRPRVHKTSKGLKKYQRKLKMGNKKVKKGENENSGDDTSLIRALYSPQNFADKLFSLLKSQNNFEYRVIVLVVLSRVISIHELLIQNFYQYCVKYLKPHQERVIKILTAIAQATHKLVPLEFIHPVIEVIYRNFVSLQNPSEICSVGINSIREIYARAPHTAESIIVNDLVQYVHDRKAEKSVVSAARSLLTVIRNSNPEILLKKYQKCRRDPKDSNLDGSSIVDDEEGSCSDFSSGVESDTSYEDQDQCINKQVCVDEITNIEKIATVYGLKKRRDSKEEIKNHTRNPHKDWRFNAQSSTTNAEKNKKKAFLMVKNKVNVKHKKTRSFQQRAAALKKSLLKQKKAKK